MQREPIEGRCNAKTRSGAPCLNWPVRGKKRCRMHGAFAGRPPVHGRYAKVLHAKLREHYAQAIEDEGDYTDLRQELHLQRSLLAEYQGRFRNGIGQQSGEDVGRVISWLDSVGKLASRASSIEARTALTARQALYLETIIVSLLEEFLTVAQREKFAGKLSDALGSVPILLLSESISQDDMD